MYQPNKKRPWLPWAVGCGLIVFLVLFVHILGGMLTPFIVAAVLAYILNPLVCKLEQYGIHRSRAAMWVMLFAFFLIVSLLLVIVPMLGKQLQAIIAKLPQLADYMQKTVLPWLNVKLGRFVHLDMATAVNWLRSNAQAIQQDLQSAMPALMQRGTALVSGLSNLALLPLLLYYFLLDWSRWEEGIRILVPRRYLVVYNRITSNMNTVLGEFLRGQITVMLIMGLIYGCGLMLVGLDSGFAIGMVAGLLVFVPYLGAFTGLLLATLASVLQFGTWRGVLSVWLVFLVGQLSEGFLITPKIVGDKIGLSPFWVIFALMAFGSVLGFVGMLVALPLAAVCLVLLREGKQAYMNSVFYQREER